MVQVEENLVIKKEPAVNRILAGCCHANGLVLIPVLFPLLAMYCVKKDRNPYVYTHGRQAMIFQAFTVVILMVMCLLYKLLVSANLVPAVALTVYVAGTLFCVAVTLCMLAGSVFALMGKPFEYPFTKNL